MINQGIDNLYRMAEMDNAQKPVTVKLGKENYLKDVLFGPCSVIINPDFSNVRSVEFRITLQTGQLHLYNYINDDKNGNDTEEKMILNIKNWFVTVPVDIGLFYLKIVIIAFKD